MYLPTYIGYTGTLIRVGIESDARLMYNGNLKQLALTFPYLNGATREIFTSGRGSYKLRLFGVIGDDGGN